MKVGLIVPQGWTGEYAGVAPHLAWQRTVESAQRADRAGLDSVWLFDHFTTTPDPTDELTFESYTSLTALAALTERVRLGHIVSVAAFRNPALQAKMISTMDVISGGRMELGIGAGWKQDEWLAYGFGFPPTRERLRHLEESLEVITRMLGPGRATWRGDHVSVDGAINLPKPLQPKLPIMIGGNGPNVTWRLAARFADELNLDGLKPAELPDALEVIRSRCEEIGRDPSSLRVSVHIWWQRFERAASRRDLLAAYRDTGVDRVMVLLRDAAQDPGAVDGFAEEARAAGAELEDVTAVPEDVTAVPEDLSH
jgi:F420-dependent oxidoreductase-like protein